FEQNLLNRERIKLSELNRGRNPMLAQIIVLNFPSYKHIELSILKLSHYKIKIYKYHLRVL
ncbi:MAG: hypothetical protein ACTSO6_11955, partial [Promethearchaeota archaeon]